MVVKGKGIGHSFRRFTRFGVHYRSLYSYYLKFKRDGIIECQKLFQTALMIYF